MKKILSIILLISFVLNCVISAAAYSEDDDVVITAPVITKGFSDEKVLNPECGLNTVSTYVLNRTNDDLKIRLIVEKNNENAGEIDAIVSSEEIRKLSLGFYVDDTDDVIEIKVLNVDTGIYYTDFENVPTNEKLGIKYTNISEDISEADDILIEFNSIIDEIEGIKLYQNNEEIEFQKSISVNNGRTLLTIHSEYLIAHAMTKLVLPGIIDIFGRTMNGKQLVFDVINISEEYEVYQKATVTHQAGIGGFAILANFEENTPEKVYFSRTTTLPSGTHDYNLPFMSSSIATVIDPNGQIAAIYDFSDMMTGKKNIVLEIPYAVEGIWQFKFTSSRKDDILEIALPNAENWGVRGETLLGVTETTPKESYIYVPQKVNDLYVATTTGSIAAKVYDSENVLQMTTSRVDRPFAKNEGIINNIGEETIYKIEVPENYTGGIMIDYAPSLMCPTIEMAQNLKGGWLDAQGVLVQGSMQKAARELLIEYVTEKNFDIVYKAPEYERGTLENPYAESYLFGRGPLSNVNTFANNQNFNVSSPYCGSFVSEETATWEDGNFHVTSNEAFADLINMDGELNVLYHNEALINRMAISVLATMLSLSEDVMIKDNNESGNSPITHGNFYFSYTTGAYLQIRDFLDEESKNVMDAIIIQLAIKQGDMPGRGPTNQWLYTLKGLTETAYSTGNDVVKGMLSRHFDGLINGPVYGKGQSSAGYFIEQGGCDGSTYNDLNSMLFYEIYKTVKTNDPDNEYLSVLKNMVQKNLEFNSLFFVSSKNGAFHANAATSRTLTYLGTGGGHATYTKIMDEFPLAKRRFELFDTLRTEELAYDNIDNYLRYGINYNSGKKFSSLYEFESYKNVMDTQSVDLPFEAESGIWEYPGVVALKHNGLYLNIFYTTPETVTLPDMSFMGGGMSILYGDGVETVSASVKHKDYADITSYDQILASCVFGKKSDGTVFVTGKEKAALEWLEADKKFKISGTTPENINVSWTYTLNDDGITQAVEATGDTSDMWLNIPISNVCEDAVVSHEPGVLKYSLDNQFVVFEWDENSEYYVTELEGIRYLRIDMSDGVENINIEHHAELSSNDITIENAVFSEDENAYKVTLKNNISKSRNVTCIVAEYTDQNRFVDCGFESLTIMGNAEDTVTINKKKAANGNVAKIMAWESFMSMYPYDAIIQ